jgi:3-hydroxybutyrate dehydrogenase
MAELDGRVALVTGGARGIGRAVAEGLAADGAIVAIADLDADGAREAASGLPGASAYGADVADAAACRRLVDDVVAAAGRVDILVNNAGLQHVSPVVDFPEERFEHLIRVMLLGAFHLTKAVLAGMIDRRWGRIVNVGSVHSLVASPNKSAYITAKHGLLGLTRTTALEVGEYGITVNLVAPTYVRTALVEDQLEAQARTLGMPVDEVVERVMLAPMAIKRLLEPSDVAAYVRFLCSTAGQSITGTAQVIDGGWTAR